MCFLLDDAFQSCLKCSNGPRDQLSEWDNGNVLFAVQCFCFSSIRSVHNGVPRSSGPTLLSTSQVGEDFCRAQIFHWSKKMQEENTAYAVQKVHLKFSFPASITTWTETFQMRQLLYKREQVWTRPRQITPERRFRVLSFPVTRLHRGTSTWDVPFICLKNVLRDNIELSSAVYRRNPHIIDTYLKVGRYKIEYDVLDFKYPPASINLSDGGWEILCSF